MDFFAIWSHGTKKTLLVVKQHSLGAKKKNKEVTGIPPGYYKCGPQLLSSENRRKIEPKEIPSCLIPHLLVVFYTQQLEILVTSLIIQKAN